MPESTARTPNGHIPSSSPSSEHHCNVRHGQHRSHDSGCDTVTVRGAHVRRVCMKAAEGSNARIHTSSPRAVELRLTSSTASGSLRLSARRRANSRITPSTSTPSSTSRSDGVTCEWSAPPSGTRQRGREHRSAPRRRCEEGREVPWGRLCTRRKGEVRKLQKTTPNVVGIHKGHRGTTEKDVTRTTEAAERPTWDRASHAQKFGSQSQKSNVDNC